MLHDIYYIMIPGAIQQPIKAAADAIIVLSVDTRGIIDNGTFQVAEKYLAEHPFCLLLQLQEQLTIAEATHIIAFFFFGNYHKPGGMPQIIVESGNEAVVKTSIGLLQQCATTQGFSSIQSIPAAVLQTIYSSGEKQTIIRAYKSCLQSTDSTSGVLYINVLQPGDLEIINQALEAEEALFAEQDPGLFTVKKQNRQLHIKIQQLERLCQAAQQEIGNQVSHNQILRSASQATALQNYYNNEYEVLPLWYKRLGHIIKVFTGKRSFKSLFSDKAKKYRD
jgi:hypothetical protein